MHIRTILIIFFCLNIMTCYLTVRVLESTNYILNLFSLSSWFTGWLWEVFITILNLISVKGQYSLFEFRERTRLVFLCMVLVNFSITGFHLIYIHSTIYL